MLALGTYMQRYFENKIEMNNDTIYECDSDEKYVVYVKKNLKWKMVNKFQLFTVTALCQA